MRQALLAIVPRKQQFKFVLWTRSTRAPGMSFHVHCTTHPSALHKKPYSTKKAFFYSLYTSGMCQKIGRPHENHDALRPFVFMIFEYKRSHSLFFFFFFFFSRIVPIQMTTLVACLIKPFLVWLGPCVFFWFLHHLMWTWMLPCQNPMQTLRTIII